jgi:hypothetical protein
MLAAGEEEPFHRVGPCAEPGQPYGMAVLVNAARIGELRVQPASRCAHFLAGSLEMVGMDEIDGAASDHFLRPVAQHGFAARADLEQGALGVHHHDQVL